MPFAGHFCARLSPAVAAIAAAGILFSLSPACAAALKTIQIATRNKDTDITLNVEGAFDYKALVLKGPDRLVVDLAASAPQPWAAPTPAGAVTSVSIEPQEGG